MPSRNSIWHASGSARMDRPDESGPPEGLPELTLARLYLGGVPVSALRRYLARRPQEWRREVATERAAELRATSGWFRTGAE